MNAIVQRVQDILLRPRSTWPVIDTEAGDAAGLYRRYLAVLAALPALAGFIGLSLVGVSAFGVRYRVPWATGLLSAAASYVLTLAMLFGLALLADVLAPTFGGRRSRWQALKLVGYASTAAFVAGLFNIVPALSLLGVLAALYSFYLVWLGAPVLMGCPPEKAAGYTAVLAACSVAAALAVGAVLSLLAPPALRVAGADGNAAVTIQTPGGELRIDGAQMEEAARRMAEAASRMEQSAQQAAAGAALPPIDPQQLRAMLPESLGALARESIEARSQAVAGVGHSQARARYRAGDERIELLISDTGGLASLMSAAAWGGTTLDRQADGKVEKVYPQDGRTVREDYATDGHRSEYAVILRNGILVEGRGDHLGIDRVREAVTQLPLARLEALQRQP